LLELGKTRSATAISRRIVSLGRGMFVVMARVLLAAEIAGLSRADFMRAVSELQVSPFQDTANYLKYELERA
jgi:hypothetical protein